MRIRTVKPEFFTHEGLYDLERETGLPIRVAFAGLFCATDREGRFRWRPRILKLDILPYDDVDFSRVLDALATRGFIRKYIVDGEVYGFIPTFLKHQVINNRESPSQLPTPIDFVEFGDACPTRAPRVTDLHVHAQGEMEYGNGNGMGNGIGNPPTPRKRGKAAGAAACGDGPNPQSLMEIWNANTDPPIARCLELSDDRIRSAKARLKKQPDLSVWVEAARRVNASAFCRGEKGGWKANFDFFVRPGTLTKIQEGKYDDRGASRPAQAPAPSVNAIWQKKLAEQEAQTK
jgi:hypothetical protein